MGRELGGPRNTCFHHPSKPTSCPSGTSPEIQPQSAGLKSPEKLPLHVLSQCAGEEKKKGGCPRSHKVIQSRGRAYKLNSTLVLNQGSSLNSRGPTRGWQVSKWGRNLNAPQEGVRAARLHSGKLWVLAEEIFLDREDFRSSLLEEDAVLPGDREEGGLTLEGS